MFKELNLRDSGVLTDMNALPVMQVEFGDFAESSSFASVQLGSLKCNGPAIAMGSTIWFISLTPVHQKSHMLSFTIYHYAINIPCY